MSVSETRMLLIGPMPIEGDRVGGAKMAFKELVGQFSDAGRIPFKLINLSRPLIGKGRLGRVALNLKTLAKVMYQTWLDTKHVDVVFLNIGPGASPASILIWSVCRLRRKPLVLRFFGGSLGEEFQALNRLYRSLVTRTFLKAELLLVETKQILSQLPNPRMAWYPNTRDLSRPVRDYPDKPKKLVFMALLNPEKGLAVAIEALAHLPSECTLHVYGPAMPRTDMKLFEGQDRVFYHGVAPAGTAAKIMAEHDLLLFPSYFHREGYPGVLLEALQCGTPVVSTRWRAIPEILEGEAGGLMVEPRSAIELANAVIRIREEPGLYQSLIQKALERGEDFRTGKWHDDLEQRLVNLA